MAKIRALHAMVRVMRDLVNSETQDYYDTLQHLVTRATGDWQESLATTPDFSSIHHAEGNCRKLVLDILKNLARQYGNREAKRVKGFESGEQYRLNHYYDVLGNRLRYFGMRLFPLPPPDRRFKPPAYRYLNKYPIPLSHPELPELDLMDLVRVHGQILCYYLFKYRVSHANTSILLDDFVRETIPFVDWIYRGGTRGTTALEKDFDDLTDLDTVIGQFRDQIKHDHANQLVEYKRTSRHRSRVAGMKFKTYLQGLVTTPFPHLEEIVEESDLSYLADTINTFAASRGTAFDRSITRHIPELSSISFAIHHGEHIPRISANSGLVITSQVMVGQGRSSGKIDVVIWKDISQLRSQGPDCSHYLPIAVIDIKTRGNIGMSLYGKPVGETGKFKLDTELRYLEMSEQSWLWELRQLRARLSDESDEWSHQLSDNTRLLMAAVSEAVDFDPDQFRPLQGILLIDGNEGIASLSSKVLDFLHSSFEWFLDNNFSTLDDLFRTREPYQIKDHQYDEYMLWQDQKDDLLDESLIRAGHPPLAHLALQFELDRNQDKKPHRYHASLVFKAQDHPAFPFIKAMPGFYESPSLPAPASPSDFVLYLPAGVDGGVEEISSWLATYHHLLTILPPAKTVLLVDISGEWQLDHMDRRLRLPRRQAKRLQSCHFISFDIRSQPLPDLPQTDIAVVAGFELLPLSQQDLTLYELMVYHKLEAEQIYWISGGHYLPYQSYSLQTWQIYPFADNDWKQPLTNHIIINCSTPPRTSSPRYSRYDHYRYILTLTYDDQWSLATSWHIVPHLRDFSLNFMSTTHRLTSLQDPDETDLAEMHAFIFDHFGWLLPFIKFKWKKHQFRTGAFGHTINPIDLREGDVEGRQLRFQIRQELLTPGKSSPELVNTSRTLRPPDFRATVNKTTDMPPHVLHLYRAANLSVQKLITLIDKVATHFDYSITQQLSSEYDLLLFASHLRRTVSTHLSQVLHALDQHRSWLLTRYRTTVREINTDSTHTTWFDLIIILSLQKHPGIPLDFITTVYEYYWPWTLYVQNYRQEPHPRIPHSQFDLNRIITKIDRSLQWFQQYTTDQLRSWLPRVHGSLIHGKRYTGLVVEGITHPGNHMTVIDLGQPLARPFGTQFFRLSIANIPELRDQDLVEESLVLIPFPSHDRFLVFREQDQVWFYWSTLQFDFDDKMFDIAKITAMDEQIAAAIIPTRSSTLRTSFDEILDQLPSHIMAVKLFISIEKGRYELKFDDFLVSKTFDLTRDLVEFIQTHADHYYAHNTIFDRIYLTWSLTPAYITYNIEAEDRCRFILELLDKDFDDFDEYPKTVSDIPDTIHAIASIEHDADRCPIADQSPEELKLNPKYRTEVETPERQQMIFVNQHHGCFYLDIGAGEEDIPPQYLHPTEIEHIHATGSMGWYDNHLLLEFDFTQYTTEDLLIMQQDSRIRRIFARAGYILMLLDAQTQELEPYLVGIVSEINFDGTYLSIPYRSRQSGEYGTIYLGDEYPNECQKLAAVRYELSQFDKKDGYDMFYNAEEVRVAVNQLQAGLYHDCEYECGQSNRIVVMQQLAIIEDNNQYLITADLGGYDLQSPSTHVLVQEELIADLVGYIERNIKQLGDLDDLQILSDCALHDDELIVLINSAGEILDDLIDELEPLIDEPDYLKVRLQFHVQYSRYLYRNHFYNFALDEINKAEHLYQTLEDLTPDLPYYPEIFPEYRGYYYESMGNEATDIYEQMWAYENSKNAFEKCYVQIKSEKAQKARVDYFYNYVNLTYITGHTQQLVGLLDNNTDLFSDNPSFVILRLRIYLKTFKFQLFDTLISSLNEETYEIIDLKAMYELSQSRYDKSIDFHHESLKIKVKNNDYKKMGYNYFYLCYIYFELGKIADYKNIKQKLIDIMKIKEIELNNQYLRILNLLEELDSISDPLALFNKIMRNTKLDYELRKIAIIVYLEQLRNWELESQEWDVFLPDILDIILQTNSTGLMYYFTKVLNELNLEFQSHLKIKSIIIDNLSKLIPDYKNLFRKKYPLLIYAN